MTHKHCFRSTRWVLYLIVLFAVIVFTRFFLAYYTTSVPNVGMDEFLYYSIGRSIATEGRLLFRGQNADYANILYPLILSPIYRFFPDGSLYYRLIQLWNIILMSSSVFPLFFLSREMLQSNSRAFLITVFCMFLPDFILGEFIFSESLLYPLFFSLIYCVYLFLSRRNYKFLLWSGLLGGLLYSTKPGAVAPAAVIIFISFFETIRNKSFKQLIFPISSFLILFGTAVVFWFIARFLLGFDGSFFSVYEDQLINSTKNDLVVFLKRLVLYPYYFILTCGIIGFVFPLVSFRFWNAESQRLWVYILISIGITIIGAAWTIEQIRSGLNIILRYVAMYIPLILLFCYLSSKKLEIQSEKTKAMYPLRSLYGILAYMALCTILLGCKASSAINDTHPFLSLSVLNDRILPLSHQVIGDVLILLLCSAVLLLFRKSLGTRMLSVASLSIMVCFMIVNGTIGYSLIRDVNYYPRLEQEGLAVRRMTNGKPYIYLMFKEGFDDRGIDVNSRMNNSIVYRYDLLNNIQNNHGIYVPFVPIKMRGMTSVHETPQVDTLVMNDNSYRFLKLSEFASSSSPYERNNIFVVHFTPGKRIFDSAVNLYDEELGPNQIAILYLFDEKQYNKPVTIRLDIENNVEQSLTIKSSTFKTHQVDLSVGRFWYDIAFEHAEDSFNLYTETAPFHLYGYDLLYSE